MKELANKIFQAVQNNDFIYFRALMLNLDTSQEGALREKVGPQGEMLIFWLMANTKPNYFSCIVESAVCEKYFLAKHPGAYLMSPYDISMARRFISAVGGFRRSGAPVTEGTTITVTFPVPIEDAIAIEQASIKIKNRYPAYCAAASLQL